MRGKSLGIKPVVTAYYQFCINTNFPTLLPIFFSHTLTIFLYINFFSSKSCFENLQNLLTQSFHLSCGYYFNHSPKLSWCHVSQSSLLALVTCPIISACSCLSYSSLDKEYVSFVGVQPLGMCFLLSQVWFRISQESEHLELIDR